MALRGVRSASISLARAFSTNRLGSIDDFLKKPKLLLPLLDTETRRPPPLTVESINAASLMKRVRADPAKLKSVLNSQVSRLLRADLVSLFFIFIRAKEVEFAEMIFTVIRAQKWYKPQTSHYYHLIACYCTGKQGLEQKQRVFELLEDSQEQGLLPNPHMFILPMSCLTRQGDFQTCMKFYNKMQSSACTKHIEFYPCLWRRYEEAGLLEEAQQIYNDFLELKNTQRVRRIVVDDD